MEECVWALIRTAMASVADLAIIPVKDYLCLGNETRMNAPSSLGLNWKWRLTRNQLSGGLIERIRSMTKLYGRL